MDYNLYLEIFQKAADQLDKRFLQKKQLEVGVGIFMDSVFLKLYKRAWVNDTEDAINAKTRIFFSVWVNDKTIHEKRIFYNIHAFKLRQLKGYSISSREFAGHFRSHFRKFQHNWENVSVKFGPLTLMEGWKKLDVENIESIIVSLARNFLGIDYLIDKTLATFEIKVKKNK